ncbi:ComF family protein [candidate division WS5 bacterium]|uniref:ComF family protein n=1 Tax=candidate division WS5 bacterium TaxID=2093353 RepID=A0A419DDI4_9BACT|nr:MAG: ComF family protein [candidate division WS5 bacterium]
MCPVCGKPAIGGETHPLCKKRYGLDGLWSLGLYQDPLRSAIKKLKYRLVKDFAEVLVNTIVEYWVKNSPQFLESVKKDQGKGWVIVPVPLHQKRESLRGFNQAGLIGRLLSKKLGLDYYEALKRIRQTRPQVGMRGFERRKNIYNVFVLDSRLLTLATNVLLVDDVWTTGSTLKECCFVLKKGGAKKVWAITLAR